MKKKNQLKFITLNLLLLLALAFVFSACGSEEYDIDYTYTKKTRASRTPEDIPENNDPLGRMPVDTINACTTPYEIEVIDPTNGAKFCFNVTWTEGVQDRHSDQASIISVCEDQYTNILVYSPWGKLMRETLTNHDINRYKIKELNTSWSYCFQGIDVQLTYEIIFVYDTLENRPIKPDTIRPLPINCPNIKSSDIARYGKNF